MSAGFHLVSYPFQCGAPGQVAVGRDCAVTLGASCANCGADGLCLVEVPWPWPGGSCGVADPTPDGCSASGAVRFRHPVAPGQPWKSWWVQGCNARSDCRRGPPYQCDFGQGACLPTLEVSLNASAVVQLPPLCAPP